MPVTEGSLNATLAKRLRQEFPGATVFKHADNFTSGVPDISFNWLFTTWLEGKYNAGGGFKSPGIQELTMRRLFKATRRAYYVLWEDRNGQKSTSILEPKDLQGDERTITAPGFDMSLVVEFIRRTHQ